MPEFERVFVRFRGRTIGPFTPDKITDMVRRGQVTRMHELSGDGLSWMKADEFGNFFPKAAPAGSVAGDMAASASSVPPGADGGTAPIANENATAQWYAHVNGEKQGPVSMDQMRLYCEANILKKDSLVWKSGMEAWKPAAETLPELFGTPAAAPGRTDTATPAAATAEATTGGEAAGTLTAEISKYHALVLAFGIGLLVLSAMLVIAQILILNQGGRQLKSTPMAAAVKISLAGALAVSGIMAVQAASKLKSALESGSAIQSLTAVRSLNQFWLYASISLLVWIAILILVGISAVAMNVPVLKVIT